MLLYVHSAPAILRLSFRAFIFGVAKMPRRARTHDRAQIPKIITRNESLRMTGADCSFVCGHLFPHHLSSELIRYRHLEYIKITLVETCATTFSLLGSSCLIELDILSPTTILPSMVPCSLQCQSFCHMLLKSKTELGIRLAPDLLRQSPGVNSAYSDDPVVG